MSSELDLLTTILAGMAAVFAFLTYFRGQRGETKGKALVELLSLLLRNESDRTRQATDDQARSARQELAEGLRAFQDSTMRVFRELREFQGTEVKAIGERLEVAIRSMDERTAAIGTRLSEDHTKRALEAQNQAQGIRESLERRFDEFEHKRNIVSRETREDLQRGFDAWAETLSKGFSHMGDQQKERLEQVGIALASLTGSQTAGQEALRASVEGRLDHIRAESFSQLEAMRKGMDEKLQSTLEQRLGESFSRVVQQLERVHQGIGDMQSLAAGVGDLKRVLTDIRVRGTFGEIQAGTLLEQFLSPEQFIRNVAVKTGSQDQVDFAVRLPGRGVEGEVLLPIDASFPREAYEPVVAAAEGGDGEALADASQQLEARVRSFAQAMRDKYLAPPVTTDFAILFLPTESLYAEVLRRPGLFEQLQRDFHVTLTGPATLTAFLNALQMGFRSIAIEKRSGEVWQILAAVKSDFTKYNEAVDRLADQLHGAIQSVEKLGIRTRAMDHQLSTVKTLPEGTAALLLRHIDTQAEELVLVEST